MVHKTPNYEINDRRCQDNKNSYLKNHYLSSVIKVYLKIIASFFLIVPLQKYKLQQSQQQFLSDSLIKLLSIYFESKMSSLSMECQHCNQLVRRERYQQHVNMHTQPHELVPKTLPNTLKKIGLSKVLHLDDTTESSDIAVRSILPDDVPQPEVERRDISAIPNGPSSSSKKDKVGGANRVGMMPTKSAPAPDVLDLTSNPVYTEMPRYNDEPLDIEKVIDLNPKKTLLPKKEVHKYQNTHNAARETVDMGGCERKVQVNPLAQSRNIMMAPSQPVYEIKEDSKPFLSLVSDPKNTATVSFSRKTGQANPYSAIETKSVLDPSKKGGEKVSSKYPNDDDFSDRYDDGGNSRYNKVGKMGSRYRDDNLQGDEYVKPVKDNSKGRSEGRPYPKHEHECPDCHGFYCSTCKSTIPPIYRPFWDENEKPEVIQYYKSLQEKAMREKGHCKQCDKEKEE